MRDRGLKVNIKSKAGMTLIEVLVAIAIFAIVAVPLFSIFSNSMKMERRALVESLTTYTAQMMMEEVYGMERGEAAGGGLLGLDGKTGSEPIVLSDAPAKEDSVVLDYLWSAEADEVYPNLIKVKLTISNDFFEVETALESLIRPAPASP